MLLVREQPDTEGARKKIDSSFWRCCTMNFNFWHQGAIQWHEGINAVDFSLHTMVELTRKTTRCKAPAAASLVGYQKIICFLFNRDSGPPSAK